MADEIKERLVILEDKFTRLIDLLMANVQGGQQAAQQMGQQTAEELAQGASTFIRQKDLGGEEQHETGMDERFKALATRSAGTVAGSTASPAAPRRRDCPPCARSTAPH